LTLTSCRRENPAIARQATASAAGTATAVAMPTATPTVLAVATAAPVAGAAAAPAASSGRQGKINGGNLGVAAFGVAAGIQLWSKPGGVMAGGATMVGTVQDGTTVDILAEDQFLGQKYYQIKGSSSASSGWIEGKFLELK